MESFIDGPPAWREWSGQRWHYSNRMRRYRDPSGLLLSNAVWAAQHGPIPAGYEVHHINEDPADDRIENLELVERHAHRSFHAPANGKKGSEAAGSAGAEAMWAKREPERRVCGNCGVTYETRST